MMAIPDDNDAQVRSTRSVRKETLDAIAQRILGVCQPERVILFGSARSEGLGPRTPGA